MNSSRLPRRLLLGVACFLSGAHFAAAAAGNPRDLALPAVGGNMLALLLHCVGRFEALAAAEARDLLKLPLWALSAALTALFAARVAPMMPPRLPALVVVALPPPLVAVGGFCLLFRRGTGNAGDEEEATSDQDQKRVIQGTVLIQCR